MCDYSRPGNGFQAATTWLTYQDAAGDVVHGGTPMGAAPVSVPYGPDDEVLAAVFDPELAATGPMAPLALLGVLLLGSGAAVRRRRA